MAPLEKIPQRPGGIFREDRPGGDWEQEVFPAAYSERLVPLQLVFAEKHLARGQSRELVSVNEWALAKGSARVGQSPSPCATASNFHALLEAGRAWRIRTSEPGSEGLYSPLSVGRMRDAEFPPTVCALRGQRLWSLLWMKPWCRAPP